MSMHCRLPCLCETRAPGCARSISQLHQLTTAPRSPAGSAATVKLHAMLHLQHCCLKPCACCRRNNLRLWHRTCPRSHTHPCPTPPAACSQGLTPGLHSPPGHLGTHSAGCSPSSSGPPCKHQQGPGPRVKATCLKHTRLAIAVSSLISQDCLSAVAEIDQTKSRCKLGLTTHIQAQNATSCWQS